MSGTGTGGGGRHRQEGGGQGRQRAARGPAPAPLTAACPGTRRPAPPTPACCWTRCPPPRQTAARGRGCGACGRLVAAAAAAGRRSGGVAAMQVGRNACLLVGDRWVPAVVDKVEEEGGHGYVVKGSLQAPSGGQRWLGTGGRDGGGSGGGSVRRRPAFDGIGASLPDLADRWQHGAAVNTAFRLRRSCVFLARSAGASPRLLCLRRDIGKKRRVVG